MNKIYSLINGEFVLKSEARILISDLSILRGYGIFDLFRTINYKPVFLEDHLERFYYSTSEMNIEVGLKPVDLKKLIQQLIDKNKIADSGVRITLTGGYSEDGYSLSKPNLLITQTPFTFNKENFKKGTRLVTYEHQRQLPQVKTIDYLMALKLQSFIKANHADDVLYFNHNEISECPRSNFFIVAQNNEILTPVNNILKGITRKKIINFPDFIIKETIIKPGDLSSIKEAFVSSTTKDILPVLMIDGKKIGNGEPGIVTRKIHEYILSIKHG